MSVKLELYRVFKEVAEAGNITAAAQTLFISQSAVSQSIKQLEAELKQACAEVAWMRATLVAALGLKRQQPGGEGDAP